MNNPLYTCKSTLIYIIGMYNICKDQTSSQQITLPSSFLRYKFNEKSSKFSIHLIIVVIMTIQASLPNRKSYMYVSMYPVSA